jgi:hypothetical protein
VGYHYRKLLSVLEVTPRWNDLDIPVSPLIIFDEINGVRLQKVDLQDLPDRFFQFAKRGELKQPSYSAISISTCLDSGGSVQKLAKLTMQILQHSLWVMINARYRGGRLFRCLNHARTMTFEFLHKNVFFYHIEDTEVNWEERFLILFGWHPCSPWNKMQELIELQNTVNNIIRKLPISQAAQYKNLLWEHFKNLEVLPSFSKYSKPCSIMNLTNHAPASTGSARCIRLIER